MNDVNRRSAWKRGILASLLHLTGLALLFNSQHDPTQIVGLILFVIGTLAFILCCVSIAQHKQVSPFLGVLGLLGIFGVLGFVVWFRIQNKRGCLISVFAVVVAFCAVQEVLFLGPARRARNRVEQADHHAILAECRQLSKLRHEECRQVPESRRKWDGDLFFEYDEGRLLSATEYPSAISTLKPVWVIMRPFRVHISVKANPAGVFLNAFATNAEAHGSRMIIEGLWYD